MRNVVAGLVFAAVGLVLSAGHAGAQYGIGDYPDIEGTGLCTDYSIPWTAMAKEAEAKRCSPGGPEWSTDSGAQFQFCAAASDSDKAARTSTMRRVMLSCESCSTLADYSMRQAAANYLHRCGFSNADGRWKLDRQFQLNRCLVSYGYGVVPGFATIYNEMVDQVNECKKTHPMYCTGCHNSQSSSAVQTIPKIGAGLRDSIERPKRASTSSTNSGNDLVSPSGPANRRATSPRGNVTSGNDLARPAGASPGNAAMDRLGGDGQFPSSGSRSSKTGEAGSRRAPAGGGASAVAKPAANTPAPAMKPDLTTDFGNCASCGKPPARPPR